MTASASHVADSQQFESVDQGRAWWRTASATTCLHRLCERRICSFRLGIIWRPDQCATTHDHDSLLSPIAWPIMYTLGVDDGCHAQCMAPTGGDVLPRCLRSAYICNTLCEAAHLAHGEIKCWCYREYRQHVKTASLHQVSATAIFETGFPSSNAHLNGCPLCERSIQAMTSLNQRWGPIDGIMSVIRV